MTLESSVLSLTESLKFAQRLKDEERQLPVVVVAANAGGVLVTNRMFKGMQTATLLPMLADNVRLWLYT